MDPARELAQLLECLRELFRRLLERRAYLRVVSDAARREPQVERQRDEALLRAVVQVALEPAPPTPSSATSMRATPFSRSTRTRTSDACACLAALVTASATT